MTNRYDKNNRKAVNRLKSIRDRKKAHSVGERRKTGKMTRTLEIPLNKKQERRQERLEKIYKQHNVTSKIVEKKKIKRKNKNRNKFEKDNTQQNNNNMNID